MNSIEKKYMIDLLHLVNQAIKHQHIEPLQKSRYNGRRYMEPQNCHLNFCQLVFPHQVLTHRALKPCSPRMTVANLIK